MTEFKEIECSKISIMVPPFQHSNFNKGIDELSHSIKQYGQLEPIPVHEKSDGQFEILTGERVFTAFNELNKKYPGKGFDKIHCRIIALSDIPKVDKIDAKELGSRHTRYSHRVSRSRLE